ncbi:MAG: 23S rRNA (uracil(1939)-C(5))-methyltransferase RlmD [Christensenellales bacterium]
MRAPVAKNEQIELDILDLGSAGEGVGRYEGYALFVPGALAGERVRVRVVKAGKSFGFGRLEEILRSSPQRTSPPCPYFGRCGGCALQHLSYDGQLAYKRKLVADCFSKIAGEGDVIVAPTLGMENAWRYRNKAAYPVALRDGRPVLGLYARRSHMVVDIADCLIQSEKSAAALEKVRQFVTRYGILPYDETSHRGLLRHVVVRTSGAGEVMATLVVNGQRLPREGELTAMLRDVPGMVSITLNQNRRRGNVILGEEERVLWGEGFLRDTIGPFSFQVSARSFFQVNPFQTERLYEAAVDAAGLTGSETVLELYCGVGSITSFLAQRACRVVGVEYSQAAVEDARRSAKENGVDATFIAGDAGQVLRDLQGKLLPDVVVLDPPRKGCDAAVLHRVADMGPKRVVYVSCEPGTLARDAALLRELGYAAAFVRPIDMFPQTPGVECVALFERAAAT